MGVPLRCPVMTEIREVRGNEKFRCGSSCVNGFRDAMEDAHLVYLEPNWGFFGVFDGHINDQCSSYLEGAWSDALDKAKKANKIPWSDDQMINIALKIDNEWLASGRDGGSTGTFFLALAEGDTIHLQVGNVGDSRVLASIKGECHALTEDHKPNKPEERFRIERYGGRVENNRVDGSLAVSRAFGDQEYKNCKGGELEQKVIALPTITHADVTFNSGDFAVLCCDGVFEGNFSNEEVIEFIQEKLKTCNDLPEVASLVCQEAINRGSRDNISCVIVQFTNGLDYNVTPSVTLIPGPFDCSDSGNFRKAYRYMAEKGHSTIGEVLERRYDILKEKQSKNELTEKENEELTTFGEGPEDSRTGEERTKFFTDFFERLETSNPGTDGVNELGLDGHHFSIPFILSLLQSQNGLSGANNDEGVDDQTT